MILFNSCKSANTQLSGNQIAEVDDVTKEEINAFDAIEEILSENFLDNSFKDLESTLAYDSLKQEISRFPDLMETSVIFPEDNDYRYYTGQAGKLPDGYNHHVAVLDYTQNSEARLYLFAVNVSGSDAQLLDYLDFNGYYNSAKTDLSMIKGEINLWS